MKWYHVTVEGGNAADKLNGRNINVSVKLFHTFNICGPSSNIKSHLIFLFTKLLRRFSRFQDSVLIVS